MCWKPRFEKGFVRAVAQQQAAGITGRSPPALAAHAAQHPAPLAPSPVFVCVFLSFQRPSDPAKSPTPHPPTLTVERTASTSPTATSSLFVPPTAPNLTTNRPQPSTDPRPLPQIARIPKQITGTHVTRPLSASKSIERTKQCIVSSPMHPELTCRPCHSPSRPPPPAHATSTSQSHRGTHSLNPNASSSLLPPPPAVSPLPCPTDSSRLLSAIQRQRRLRPPSRTPARARSSGATTSRPAAPSPKPASPHPTASCAA